MNIFMELEVPIQLLIWFRMLELFIQVPISFKKNTFHQFAGCHRRWRWLFGCMQVLYLQNSICTHLPLAGWQKTVLNAKIKLSIVSSLLFKFSKLYRFLFATQSNNSNFMTCHCQYQFVHLEINAIIYLYLKKNPMRIIQG